MMGWGGQCDTLLQHVGELPSTERFYTADGIILSRQDVLSGEGIRLTVLGPVAPSAPGSWRRRFWSSATLSSHALLIAGARTRSGSGAVKR